MKREQILQYKARNRALDAASRMISRLRTAKIEITTSLEGWADNEQSRACAHIDEAISELRRAILFVIGKE